MEVHLIDGIVEVAHQRVHLLLEIDLHVRHGFGEVPLAQLHPGELVIEGVDLLLSALDDGRQNLRRLLPPVRELLHQPLVHAQLHGQPDVLRIDPHILHLAPKGLDEAIDGGLGGAVQLVEEAQLALHAVLRLLADVLIGGVELIDFLGQGGDPLGHSLGLGGGPGLTLAVVRRGGLQLRNLGGVLRLCAGQGLDALLEHLDALTAFSLRLAQGLPGRL